MHVALTYNLVKSNIPQKGEPLDKIAELDAESTIKALKNALESGGHQVTLVEADINCFEKFRELKGKIDIVFNVAEGISGEARESQVPVILEMLDIPYVGSGPVCLALSLDKARTKEILGFYGVPIAKFQVFYSPEDKLDSRLRFPLFCKLLAEGSKIGMSAKSKVSNEKELQEQVDYLIKTYKEPVVVEEFLQGDEITVPIIGNKEPMILPFIRVVYETKTNFIFEAYDQDDPVAKDLMKGLKKEIKTSEAKYRSEIPAKISAQLEKAVKETSLKTYRIMGCRDWARIDLRCDKDGIPNVMELNPIAGIDPDYWFAKSARVAGIEYNDLINRILDYAVERYGL